MDIVAETWIKNNTYHLKFSDSDITLSVTGWFNDSLMDAAQTLICKSLGCLESWQSILNWQKSDAPFFKVRENQIQLLHDRFNHWLLSFNSSCRVQLCGNLCTNISGVTKTCLRALYKLLIPEDGKLTISVVLAPTQKDSYNCGLFAIAFVADI